MKKLYSYIIPVDDGAAPNPFGGICTLTICKPAIRRSAVPGNWIIGTGSKRVAMRDGEVKDFSRHLVYAMLVTEKKTLEEYDKFCQQKLKIKIPKKNSRNYSRVVGDCQYSFTNNIIIQREGIHDTETQFIRDLSGKNSLLSDHFYYFGSKPIKIPIRFKDFIHTTQNCKLIKDEKSITAFENWISRFKKNFVHAEPQLQYAFENRKC
jgi:hypothetical protein